MPPGPTSVTKLADRIPSASFSMAPGHGHLSLPIAYRDEILKDLLSVASA